MLIEFFGAPGAGKSTLAKAVAARVQAHTRHQLSAQWHRQSTLQKAIYIARGFAKPDRVIAAARLAFRCRLRSRASIAQLCRIIAKSEWSRSQHGLVLLDQGFLQDLWSVLYTGRCHEPQPAHLSPFLRSIFPRHNALIVFVAVDPKTAFRRIRQRSDGHSRLDSLAEEELRSSLERTAQLPHTMIDGAMAAGLQVVTLDGSEQVDVLAQHILALLLGKSQTPGMTFK